MAKGGICVVEGACMVKGACVAGGVYGMGECVAGGCMVGSVRVGEMAT